MKLTGYWILMCKFDVQCNRAFRRSREVTRFAMNMLALCVMVMVSLSLADPSHELAPVSATVFGAKARDTGDGVVLGFRCEVSRRCLGCCRDAIEDKADVFKG